MPKRTLHQLILTLLLFSTAGALFAAPTASIKRALIRDEASNTDGEQLLVPYAFSTNTIGTVAGLGYMKRGFYQKQMTTGLTAFGGKESTAAAIGVWDYRPAAEGRFFISTLAMLGNYPRNRAYALPHALPIPNTAIRPGAHDSDKDHYIEAQGSANFFDIKMEWVLPMGAAKEQPMMRYKLKRGLLVDGASGGDNWNPLTSGVTVAVLRQFNRYQSFVDEQATLEQKIHGLEIGLLYDNTDFSNNPSKGSRQYLSTSLENRWGSSDNQWTALTAETSHFFSLGATEQARQRIIAVNAWTAYSPSWRYSNNDDGKTVIEDAPPFNQGATLGGYYRMRGFSSYRFHDKAAIYATAEYRYTLEWNPVANISWLQFLKADWFQIVPFFEAGRVAPSYQLDTLFSNWHSDAGIGLRGMMAGTVLRVDFAHSSEGNSIWAMVSQPF